MSGTSMVGEPTDAKSPARVSLAPVVQALRPYQWVKNLLLGLPLLLSHRWEQPGHLRNVLLAMVAFSLCASSAYVLNDLRDAEDDRHHPLKRHRPFASGRLSRGAGVFVSIALLVLGFGLSVPLLPVKFTVMLGVYVATTLAYSFWLKQKLLVDVFVLALLEGLSIPEVSEILAVPLNTAYTRLRSVRSQLARAVERRRGAP